MSLIPHNISCFHGIGTHVESRLKTFFKYERFKIKAWLTSPNRLPTVYSEKCLKKGLISLSLPPFFASNIIWTTTGCIITLITSTSIDQILFKDLKTILMELNERYVCQPDSTNLLSQHMGLYTVYVSPKQLSHNRLGVSFLISSKWFISF